MHLLVDRLNYAGFYFCRTSDCPIVYFNNAIDKYMEKEDVKTRVGIKETEPPIPVCYCMNVLFE